MNIDRHNQAEELLGAMLELPPEERDAFLDDQCGSDTALRADVDKLRLAHERGNGNPATAAAPAAAPATVPDAKDDPDKSSLVEQLLGACPDQLWEIPAGDARTMPGSPVPDNLPPSLGKRYQIERELGRGGMGRVYLAGDKKLKRKVALKMLPEVCTSEPRRRAMFEREACTAANLNHANVATVYEFEDFDGKPCISMEYVEGRPLREILENEQQMPLARLLDIAVQITEGLHAAHRRSIIHRDLKPANVMVTDEGLVKILDFGLAKALHAGVWDADTRGGPESVGSSGVLLGTPGYMSPEQARREEDVDERTDLFSLGIVLYEMATGDGPFHRHTPEECISAALNEEPRPVTALNSNLPTAAADVINKLLEKGKGDRYQSAEEVLEDLRELVAAQEAGRKKGLLKWLLAAAMVVLAVGGVERIFRKPPEPAAKTITWIRSCAKQDLFGKAWEGYAKLQHSHGKEHPTVEMLLGYVRKEESRFLQARRNNLERSLVGGRFEQAKDALARIEHLAEISTPTGARAGGQDTPDVVLEQARDLFKRAERKKRDVEGLVRDTGGLLTKGQFSDAWQQIMELGKIQFDSRLFTPATRARDSLRTQLADEIVRWVEQVTLDNITKDNAELLKTYFDLLQTVDPSNDALERFQRKTTDAQREVRMAEHYVEASKSDIQLARLRDIHGEMELLGPKDRRTEEISNRLAKKEAEDKLERTQKQLWEDLVREFEKGRVAPLGRTIAKAREKGVDRLALDRADHALTWLKTLRDVKPHGNNTGPARKQYAQLVTRAPRLDAPFRDAAQRHLRELDDALRLEEAKATANAIYIGIQNSCKKRRVKEAVAQLKTLKLLKQPEGLNIPGLQAKIHEANRILQQLETDLQEQLRLEGLLDEYREALRQKRFTTAEGTYRQLQDGWKKVAKQLDAAIVASGDEPDTDLVLQQAKLSLRLGQPVAAERDASRAFKIARTTEAQRKAGLLWAQAEFAQSDPGGKRKLERVSAALARLKTLGREDARILCWKGVCQNDLALGMLEGSPAQRNARDQALQDLRQAIKDGCQSAVAYLFVARLVRDYKNPDKLRDAVKQIKEGCEKPWEEDGLIAAFGKVPSVDKAKEQWRNIYIDKAYWYRGLQRWVESRDAAQKAVDVGGDYALSYLALACAKLKLGDLRGCELDLDKAKSLLNQVGNKQNREDAKREEERLRVRLEKQR